LNAVAVRILEGADQEAGLTTHVGEHLPVASLGPALGLKHANGIPKAKAEPFIDVGHPG